jgi:hypothetical protein
VPYYFWYFAGASPPCSSTTGALGSPAEWQNTFRPSTLTKRTCIAQSPGYCGVGHPIDRDILSLFGPIEQRLSSGSSLPFGRRLGSLTKPPPRDRRTQQCRPLGADWLRQRAAVARVAQDQFIGGVAIGKSVHAVPGRMRGTGNPEAISSREMTSGDAAAERAMTIQITRRQLNVLAFIRARIERDGQAPTLKEIGDALGIGNVSRS